MHGVPDSRFDFIAHGVAVDDNVIIAIVVVRYCCC